jgi:hypothetical protein
MIQNICDICHRSHERGIRELTGHWMRLTGCKDICSDCLKEINSIWGKAKAIAVDCSDYHIKQFVANTKRRSEVTGTARRQ